MKAIQVLFKIRKGLTGLTVLAAVNISSAELVNLATGAPGATVSGQSFNETRAVDVTVLSGVDLVVSSMTLEGLAIGGASSALMGARIYNGDSSALVASADTTISASGPATVPITALLKAGGRYRIGFYVQTNPLSQATGTFISNSGGFPYTGPGGLFRINSAHSVASDTFPSNSNIFVPKISVWVRPANANLAAGAPGFSISGQSFNETRAVDVTVLSSVDLAVSSMTLEGLNIAGATSALVGARIYNNDSSALVAAADTTITANGPATVPISALLKAGGHYRIGFYVQTDPPSQGTGTFISNSGGFPYTGPGGLFRINSAHSVPSDAYPSNSNIFVPKISVWVRPANANLAAGAPGSTIPGQSFNETRAVDVTVLSGADLAVSSMTLEGLNIGGATSALVGARIYNGDSSSLVASANTTITSNGPATVPITALLKTGGHYRIGFYVQTVPLSQATGTFINNSGGFPYTESGGLFRINTAHAIASDAYPSNSNIFVPQVIIGVSAETRMKLRIENNMAILSWTCMAGDQFTIEESVGLTSFSKLPSQGLLTASNGSLEVQVEMNGPTRFYRAYRH